MGIELCLPCALVTMWSSTVRAGVNVMAASKRRVYGHSCYRSSAIASTRVRLRVMRDSPYCRAVDSPPEALVRDGRFCFGTFNEPFRIVNPEDASRPLGAAMPRFVNRFRLKEWEAFQLGNDDYFLVGAVYNAKALGLVQLAIVHKHTGRKWLYEKQVPSWSLQVASGLYSSRSEYRSRGLTLIIRNQLERNRFTVEVDIAPRGEMPRVRGAVTAHHTTEPIVICQPFGDNRALYSHKALMPAEGKLEVGAETLAFAQARSFMVVDDHKGYYPFPMKYDWVTAAGFAPDGALVGFNLTDNQVQNHDLYNENCLWHDGTMQVLPPVRITRPNGVYAPWQIKDTHGMVELSFTPKVKNEVMINILGVLGSDYYGPYGDFEGRIRRADGSDIDFTGFYGMGEQKMVRI